jgi:hypothetical protein
MSDFDAIGVVKTGTIISFTGSTANVAMPTDSAGNLPKYVRLTSTQACYVKIGPSGVTAAAGDILVQPADAVVVKVFNQTFVAAIQVTTAGVLQISPLEDR